LRTALCRSNPTQNAQVVQHGDLRQPSNKLLIEIGLRTCGSTQIDDSLNRRGWAWPGHPRDAAQALPVSVDARHKAGQDDLAETESSDCNSEH
jgi:hypothetical protein